MEIKDETLLWQMWEGDDVSQGYICQMLGIYVLEMRVRHEDWLKANHAMTAFEVREREIRAKIEKHRQQSLAK